MSNEHVSLPVTTPPLDHLTDDELNALRGKLASTAKDARRKANHIIQRSPSLKKPWSKSLSFSKNVPTDERAAIMAEFERELLRVPEAYIAHAYANSMIMLESACRDALKKRPVRKAKAAPDVAPPKPEAPPEGPLDALFKEI